MLAFHNRSGSNLLAESLRSTPHFTGFGEQLIDTKIESISQRWKLKSFPDYVQRVSKVAEKAQQPGGPMPCHGFKASWAQLIMLLRFRIDRMYPSVRVIHLTRDDKVGQAVSHSIAFQTKQWTSSAGQAVKEPEFNGNQIEAVLRAIVHSEQVIPLVCSITDIPRHGVTYEQLVADPVAVMAGIGSFIGKDLSGWTPAESSLRKQRTALNDEFREKFLAYYADRLRISQT